MLWLLPLSHISGLFWPTIPFLYIHVCYIWPFSWLPLQKLNKQYIKTARQLVTATHWGRQPKPHHLASADTSRLQIKGSKKSLRPFGFLFSRNRTVWSQSFGLTHSNSLFFGGKNAASCSHSQVPRARSDFLAPTVFRYRHPPHKYTLIFIHV